MSRFSDEPSLWSLLRRPGVMVALVSSSLCRLSFAMFGLSLLLSVEHATHSYGAAGLANAAYGLGALSAPLKARWIDQHGLGRIVSILGVAYSASLLILGMAVASGDSGTLTYCAFAGCAGLLAPPLGPAMRGLWSHLSDGVVIRERVLSLDVALEDTLFTLGPLLVGILSWLEGPMLPLFVCTIVMFAGTPALVRSSAAVMPAENVERGRPGGLTGVVRSPGMAGLLGVVALLATGLGCVDVSIVARAMEQGAPAAAGYVLAAMALGSVLIGPLWARQTRFGTVKAQLWRLALVIGACQLVASEVKNLAYLSGVVVMMGSAITPTLVLSFVTAERLTPSVGRTEVSAWVNASFNMGIALGSTAGGLEISHHGSGGAFLLSVVSSTLALACATILGGRWERSHQ